MHRWLVGSFALAIMLAMVTPVSAGTVYIPLATNAETDFGSFETQILLTNAADVNRPVEPYFIKSETDGVERPDGVDPELLRVAPGTTLTYVPVADLGESGLLELTMPSKVLAQARLVGYEDGQANGAETVVPVITDENLLSGGSEAFLQGLMLSPNENTDFGIVNLGVDNAQCEVDVFRGDGSQIGSTFLVGMKPLSHRQFRSVFEILGEASLENARMAVRCDQSFYTYGVVINQEASSPLFVSPSGSGESRLSKPGDGGGSNTCGSNGGFCFEQNGIFHVPTRGNPVHRITFPMDPGQQFSRLRVLLTVKHNGWFNRNSGGIHNFFWLARNRYRSNTFGYVNVRGPNRNLVSSLTNVNLPSGVTQRVVQPVQLNPGETYNIDYTYDTSAGRIELIMTNSRGQQVINLVDTTRVRNITTEGDGFIMDFGLTEVANDVPTYGWEYSNLVFELIP